MNKVLSPKEVAKLYAEKMPDASKDEEARSSHTTIADACMVYEKLFEIEEVRKVIETWDKMLKSLSPFNSIGK